MPTYEYRCSKCHTQTLESRGINEGDAYPPCPTCQTPMVRLYNFGAVTFNGSGFYRTDK